MSDLFPITREEMLREVEREIAMRKHVYLLRVRDGRLSQNACRSAACGDGGGRCAAGTY